MGELKSDIGTILEDEDEPSFSSVDVKILRSKSSQWKSFVGKLENYAVLQSRSPTPCTPVVPRSTSTPVYDLPIVIDGDNATGINGQHWSVYSQNIEQLLMQRERLQNK